MSEPDELDETIRQLVDDAPELSTEQTRLVGEVLGDALRPTPRPARRAS